MPRTTAVSASLACSHERLQLDVSPCAKDAGFCREPLQRRIAAASARSRSWDDVFFPGPLVLPGDALALDPREPPQSLEAWRQSRHRNKVTPERKTIYVAPPPEIDPEFHGILPKWEVPSMLKAPLKGGCDPPKVEQVWSYLEAFYYPLPVKLLSDEVRFIPWSDGKSRRTRSSTTTPKHIGLQIGNTVTRITTRPCPDKVFPRQLDLNNILDAAMQALPEDAYALVMMVNHDLYEDEDDDFCCGRAYGGSRISVASSARYNPFLDDSAGIQREHMWPFSHCNAYMERLCEDAKDDAEPEPEPKPKKRKRGTSYVPPRPAVDANKHPLGEVIQAGLAAARKPSKRYSGLWLSRVARTVSHELGHCFCYAHCVYYACVMQGTAGIVEDVRQPPYICLVCEAKLGIAIRDLKLEEKENFREVEWQIERYGALAKFCKQWETVPMFAGYRRWLEKRIEALKVTATGNDRDY
ncbi:hypothetical protein VTI74DRAFT_9360 [Chaetomium olivicolor]